MKKRFLEICQIHRKTPVLETLNKIAGLPATLLKRSLWARCFAMNFAKFLRTPFLENTSVGCFWWFIVKPWCQFLSEEIGKWKLPFLQEKLVTQLIRSICF